MRLILVENPGAIKGLGDRFELRCCFLQILVDERDRHAALADCGGDALHLAEANVTTREDARNAGLEEIWISVELPVRRRRAASSPVRT